jgi:uncharacterized RDD family membrane protein YckC
MAPSPRAGPVVAWGPPARPPAVPGATGLSFADTTTRAAAFIFDSFILGVAGLMVLAALGKGGATTLDRTSDPNAILHALQAPVDPVTTILSFAFGAVYFIVFWTGGRRATPGQRAFQLQVGNAFDGRPLSIGQAFRRWAALGSPLGLLGLVPGLAGVAGLAALGWFTILFVSTATSATRQGFHDRFAKSAVVRPSDQETSGLAVACVVVVVLLVVLAVLATAVLIILGPQILAELSRLGRSI